MTINELHEKLKVFPTILNIEDEIFFINHLKKTSLNDIKSHIKEFIYILDSLQVSHQENGIFDVYEENINIFFEFSLWIKEIQQHINNNIERYIDGFDTNFDKSIKLDIDNKQLNDNTHL